MAREEEILAEMKAVAKECAALAYKMRMNPEEMGVDLKDDKSLVTATDPLVEKMIRERLTSKFGGSFYGEEGELSIKDPNSDLLWVVDPIDGTTNFSRGTKEGAYPDMSTWGISIGLKKAGEPYIGAIYKPQTDEMFSAISGKGAFVETEKYGVSYEKKLQLPEEFKDDRTLIGFGVLDRHTVSENHVKIYDGFKDAVKGKASSSTSRSQGASGIETPSVACGTLAAYVSSAAEHDIAASRVLLQEAGASLTTIADPNSKDGKYFYMVASHPEIHDELVRAVKETLLPTQEIEGDLEADDGNKKICK